MRTHWGFKQNPTSGKLVGVKQEGHRGNWNDRPVGPSALVALDPWSQLALVACRAAVARIEQDGVARYETVAWLIEFAALLDVVDTEEASHLRGAARQQAWALRLRTPTLKQKARDFLRRCDLRYQAARGWV